MSDLANARAAAAPAERTVPWQSLARAFALVAAGSWLGYLLFTGMPQLTLDVFPRTITLHIFFGVAAAVYVLYLAAARRLPGGTPLDLPALGLIAAYIIATYTSISWRVSLGATLNIGVAIIVFYALSDLPYLSAAQLRRALLLVAGALSIYALWVVGNDYADYLSLTHNVEGLRAGNIFPPTVPRVHDLSDHPNVLAMLLALVAPFFALTAYRARSPLERAGAFTGLLVVGMTLFLTLSRGGWAGAGAGVVFTLTGAWLTERAFQRERDGERFTLRIVVPRDVSPTAVAAVGGAIALIAIGTLAFLARSSTRPGWLFRSSLSPREDAWHAGWDIFRDHVLTGAGPSTFGLIYPQYSGKFLVHTQHAHNGFLQAADDLGLIGGLALLVLAGAIVYVLYRTWRDGALEQRLLAVACAGALIAFCVHNQVDAGNIWKAPAFGLAVVGAIIVRNYRERADRTGDDEHAGSTHPVKKEHGSVSWRGYAPLVPRVALLALLFVPFLAWYRIDAAHYDYWRAMDDFNHRGDPARTGAGAAALREMQDAVNGDSSLMVYQLQLGQMQATAYQESGKKNQALIEAAVIHLRRAVALDKRSDIAHADLARAYQLAGRPDDAVREAAKTRYIARYHVQPVLMVGEIYEDMGRTDDAIDTYAQVISTDAGLTDSSYWDATPFRRKHFDEIVARSALGINPCTHGAYLVEAYGNAADLPPTRLDTDAKGCQLLVFSRPTDLVLRVAFAKILMAQGKLDDAFTHLDYAVRRQPDFGPAHTRLGRWHQAKGDVDEARHQWVLGSQLDEAESLLLLGDSYPAGAVPSDVISRLRKLIENAPTRVTNDLVSILYYRMKYARVSPVVSMIPGPPPRGWQDAEPRVYAQMRAALARWQR